MPKDLWGAELTVCRNVGVYGKQKNTEETNKDKHSESRVLKSNCER